MFSLVSAAGLTHAMARTDAEILNDVVSVSYEQKPSFQDMHEVWHGELSDGGDLTIGYIPMLDVIEYFSTSEGIGFNIFLSEESQRKALNYLKQKYNEQEQAHNLTQ